MPIESTIASQFRRIFTHDASAAVTKAPAQEVEHKLAVPVDQLVSNIRPVDAASYKLAVDRLNQKVAAERALTAPDSKAALRLEAHDESIFLAQPTPNAKGTVLMFHGFTAGPWQYQELAEKLHADGYNVYAPRLPGHGLVGKDGMNTNERFVHARDRQRYDAYVDARFREAAALGAPIYTLGLSGGSNVALRTAEKHPEVKGVFAMAPFLGPNHPGKWLFDTLRFLDKATFGLSGRLMDLIPQSKNVMSDRNNLLPHTEPTFGEALAAEELGHNIKSIRAPIQYVTTAGDGCSGTELVAPLFERTGGASKNGWYHFAPEKGVPHPMISRAQDKAPGAVDKLNQMVLDFLHGERTMSRPPEATPQAK